ncbi:hypothetical protein B9T19_04660 [Ignatzschineria sp. F8392]|uniref:hypothetical protein n=1 Tax=Ignatzschineria sp. F8392 TaxID=1980117 RepID=UPI000B996088|nr:hypothetical protein [Ignatzschineria sp. F8392]OYQ80540.1 hypothetical protein B9T19_04660 [Ignatzschineria sp. F8392]
MTTRPDQVYQQDQSGRITLTFFFIFNLFALITYIIGFTLLNKLVADGNNAAMELSKIVPFSTITFSAILPLGLILGFWMSGFAKQDLGGLFRLMALKRGFILSFFYLLVIVGIIFFIDEPIAQMLGISSFSYRIFIIVPIGAVLGAIFAYICAAIAIKFSKVAKAYDENPNRKPGRIEEPN